MTYNRNTYVFLLSILLIWSCTNNRPEKTDEILVPYTDSIVTTITTIDTTSFYPSFHVKDSSWKVALDIQEGFLISYSISYKNKTAITKNVESETPSIGGVDYPEPHYINDTTYFIPNLGASKRGYYEMYIYKNGKHKFHEIITIKNKMIEQIEDVSSVTVDEPTRRPPEILNKFIQSENEIKFSHHVKNFGNPDVGCSQHESDVSFTIPNVADSFCLTNHQLTSISCKYNYFGGLYEEWGSKIIRGTICGKGLENNTWQINASIWIEVHTFPDKKIFEKHIELNEIFN